MKLRHITLLSILILIPASYLLSQNQTPIVENVTFTQRTDGSFKVDIHYDVNDTDGNTMIVSMQVSDDNDTTWNISCNNITGDVGTGITSGTGKHIVWDFGTEHPETFGDQFRIKILADDGVNEGGGEPCPGIPTVTYAGKVYNTVQIGDQCWLKENLDVGMMIESNSGGYLQTDNGVIEKYCYNNDASNCNAYGGLYEWTEAMQYVTTEGTQGICPSGWHIPTYAEFQVLETFVDDQPAKLIDISQTTSGYTATNETGFSALFAGRRYLNTGSFYGLSYDTYFWSSTERSSYRARNMSMFYDISNVHFGSSDQYGGFSVRCLKD